MGFFIPCFEIEQKIKVFGIRFKIINVRNYIQFKKSENNIEINYKYILILTLIMKYIISNQIFKLSSLMIKKII